MSLQLHLHSGGISKNKELVLIPIWVLGPSTGPLGKHTSQGEKGAIYQEPWTQQVISANFNNSKTKLVMCADEQFCVYAQPCIGLRPALSIIPQEHSTKLPESENLISIWSLLIRAGWQVSHKDIPVFASQSLCWKHGPPGLAFYSSTGDQIQVVRLAHHFTGPAISPPQRKLKSKKELNK